MNGSTVKRHIAFAAAIWGSTCCIYEVVVEFRGTETKTSQITGETPVLRHNNDIYSHSKNGIEKEASNIRYDTLYIW